MKKFIKIAIIAAVVVLLGFNSVYFRKLSDVQKEQQAQFDAPAYAQQLWKEQLPAKLDSAISLIALMQAVTADPVAAFEQHTHALGIGNYRYALVKLDATVTAITEDDIRLQFNAGDSLLEALLATEYIYGNAIRDASGLVDIRDFPNTTDLNNISEELNRIVRSSVVPAFRQQVKTGNKVQLVAAVELNREHIKWNQLELLPLRLQILP